MPELDFRVESAEPLTFAASPHLVFKILVTNADPQEQIKNVMLRCQIQIETVKRQYAAEEKERLFELYGESERWGQTLKTLLWTHANVLVPPFSNKVVVDMHVPCTFDVNVATTKYFSGLSDGHIPLCLLFSGTIFYRDADGSLQVSQISWEKEATFQLPVSVWQKMMEHYYPNSAWLNIRRDVFERLQDYKVRNAIPSWELALDELLVGAEDALADETINVQSKAVS